MLSSSAYKHILIVLVVQSVKKLTTSLRDWSPVWLVWIALHKNNNVFFVFGQIKSSKTGDLLYSDPSPTVNLSEQKGENAYGQLLLTINGPYSTSGVSTKI